MSLLVLALGTAACSEEGSGPRTGAVGSPRTSPSSASTDTKKDGSKKKPPIEVPAGYIATPQQALRHCPASPPLTGDCPTIVPDSADHFLVESFGKPGGRFQVVEMTAGAPRRDPKANAPPSSVHVVIEAGDERHLIDFGDVAGSAPLEDALLEKKREAPVGLGKRTWGDFTGDLILAPSFPSGGAHGDHLVFRWRKGKTIHNVSLHAWVPIAEAESALKRMVMSIPH